MRVIFGGADCRVTVPVDPVPYGYLDVNTTLMVCCGAGYRLMLTSALCHAGYIDVGTSAIGERLTASYGICKCSIIRIGGACLAAKSLARRICVYRCLYTSHTR